MHVGSGPWNAASWLLVLLLTLGLAGCPGGDDDDTSVTDDDDTSVTDDDDTSDDDDATGDDDDATGDDDDSGGDDDDSSGDDDDATGDDDDATGDDDDATGDDDDSAGDDDDSAGGDDDDSAGGDDDDSASGDDDDSAGTGTGGGFPLIVNPLPDMDVPHVVLALNPDIVLPGATTTISVATSDDIGVTFESLTVDGSLVPVTNGVATFVAPNTPGLLTVVAMAQDALGNQTEQTATLVVADVSDTVGPTVTLDAPLDNTRIGETVDVVATIDDDSGTVLWSVLWSPRGAEQWTTIGTGSGPVVNDVVDTLDPTLLPDGWIDLRVRAVDPGGNWATNTQQMEIDSPTKVGNMVVTFQEMRIPMSGVPITVNRRYDSRTRGQSGDFGYGWDLDHKSITVSKSKPEGQAWTQQSIFLFFTWYWQLYAPTPPEISFDFGAGAVREFTMGVSPSLKSLIPWQMGDFTQPVYSEQTQTGAALYQGVGQPAYVQHDTAFWLFDYWGNLYDPDTYQLVLEDGTWLHLSVDTGIMEMQDPVGNHIEFGTAGIIHSAGKSVLYTRDADDRIVEMTDPDGNVITYTYTDAGDLESVTNRDGNTTWFSYTAEHYLKDIVDPNGVRVIRNFYDDDGRLAQQCDGEGNCVDIAYDSTQRQELKIDRLGYASLITYDASGRVIEEQDEVGRTVEKGWDASGNLINEVRPSGAAQSHSYTGVRRDGTTDYNGCSDAILYDSAGRPVEVTDKLGEVRYTTFTATGHLDTETDRLGNTRVYVHDAAGNLIEYTDKNGSLTTYTYDAYGNKLSETDPEGNVQAWVYDSLGRRTSQTAPDGGVTLFTYDNESNLVAVTGPDGGVESYTYDSAGKEQSRTDALGRTWTYTYDFNGNKTTETGPDGNTVAIVYDAEDQKVAEVDALGFQLSWIHDGAGQQVEIVKPDGTSVLKTYDDDGNVLSEEDALGNVTSYGYDSMERRTSRTDPLGNTTSWVYDCMGHVIEQTDAAGVVTNHTYDAEGRRSATTRGVGTPLEATTSMVFDAEGNMTEKILPDGSSWLYAYDGVGNVASVEDPSGAVTNYTWDARGNVVTVVDALGRTTAYTYNLMGLRTSKTTPTGRTTSWTHDAGGRVVSQTDPSGGVTSYVWDDSDRLLQATFPDGTVEAYTFDAIGNRLQADVDGDVWTWTHDEMGRPLDQTNPDGSTMAWTYDAMGRVVEVTGVVGGLSHTLYRTYDTAGRLVSVADDLGRETTYGYDARGSRLSENRTNGTWSTWAYDDLGRLTAIDHYDALGNLMDSYAYTLDDNGLRTGVTEGDGSTVGWTYDAAGRLASETRTGTGAQTQTWLYDAVGNRVESALDGTVSTWTYDDDDRLLSDGTKTWAYDDLGQVVSVDDGTDLDTNIWDHRGRLIGVDRNGSPLVTYAYDADGNRTLRDDGTTEVNYLVDTRSTDLSMVLMETDAAGGALATYMYGDELAMMDRGGERWYVKDGVGSVRGLNDSTGAWSDTWTYDAFGLELDRTGTTSNAYQYAGEQIDPLTDWYYVRARYLDPASGRFLSEDPYEGRMREPMSLHRYLYTPSDPVNYSDPTGESWAALGRLALSMSVSLTWGAFALRWAIQLIMWTALTYMVTEYVIVPASKLVALGRNLGGPIGTVIGRAGKCIAAWAARLILTQFLWTFIRALLPIVGAIMGIYNLVKWHKQLSFMVKHRKIITTVLDNIPTDIPRGNKFSACVEAQSGVPARALDRQLVRFKADYQAGRDPTASLAGLMNMLVPIYAAIQLCYQQFKQPAAA